LIGFVALFVFSLNRKGWKNKSIARPYLISIFLSIIYTLLIVFSSSLSFDSFGNSGFALYYIASSLLAFIPVLFLITIILLVFQEFKKKINLKYLYLLLIPSGFFSLLLLTSEWHNFVIIKHTFVDGFLSCVWGVGGYLFAAYLFVIYLVGLGFVLILFLSTKRKLLLGIIVTFLSSIVFYFLSMLEPSIDPLKGIQVLCSVGSVFCIYQYFVYNNFFNASFSKLLKIYQNTKVGYIITDNSGKIIDTNDTLFNLFPSLQISLSSTSINDFIQILLEKNFSFSPFIENTPDSNFTYTGTIENKANEFVKMYSFKVVPFFVGEKYDGTIIAISLMHDSHSAIRIGAQRKKMQEQLTRKKEYYGNLSHEFGSAMNNIILLSNLLQKEQLSPIQSRYIKEIYSTGQHLYYFLNEVFSKYMDNNISLVNERYNFYSIIDEIVATTDVQIGQRNIKFYLDIDPGIPEYLYGDSQKLKSILSSFAFASLNYEINTIKFKISYIQEEKNITLLFVISDTASHSYDEVNEQVTYIENTEIELESLSTSKKIIELMEGKIVEFNPESKNSKISFTIKQKVVSSINLDLSEYKYNVLVIDDDYESALIIENILHKFHIATYKLDATVHLSDELRRNTYTHVLTTLNSKYQITNIDYHGIEFILMVNHKEMVPARLQSYPTFKKPFVPSQIYQYFNKESDTRQNFNKTALIIDDDPINLLVLDAMLKQYNITSTLLSNGRDALSTLQSNRYDIIFIDQVMKDMTGSDTIQVFRKFKGAFYLNTPVICVTSSDVTKLEKDTKIFQDVLKKPIDENELKLVLDRFLNKEESK
jgi:CheY-like chemotaxis protein/signal transduction histidine kinase